MGSNLQNGDIQIDGRGSRRERDLRVGLATGQSIRSGKIGGGCRNGPIPHRGFPGPPAVGIEAEGLEHPTVDCAGRSNNTHYRVEEGDGRDQTAVAAWSKADGRDHLGSGK